MPCLLAYFPYTCMCADSKSTYFATLLGTTMAGGKEANQIFWRGANRVYPRAPSCSLKLTLLGLTTIVQVIYSTHLASLSSRPIRVGRMFANPLFQKPSIQHITLESVGTILCHTLLVIALLSSISALKNSCQPRVSPVLSLPACARAKLPQQWALFLAALAALRCSLYSPF